MRYAVAAGVAMAVVCGGLALAQDGPVRLDPNAIPERYELTLTPDLAAMRFSGSETVRVRLKAPSRTLTLNAADLDIASASVDGQVAKVTLDAKAERLSLELTRPLAAGAHALSISYAGKINQTPRGMFAVKYEEAGQPRIALATQLEAIDARRVLPCWDEPDHKAVFAVSVIVPKGQIAVSNMPAAKIAAEGGDRQRFDFAPTPAMSPYLLFVGAGEFVRVSKRVGGVEIGVVTSPTVATKADFTIDNAGRLLDFYGRYFDRPFPLPKLDFFLMPGSGRPVGMENWGAVFGYEGGFIIDPKQATTGARSFVYLVIAHELAHQWFGDLVTMKWWDDTWLNESFASWLQVKASDHFHPEWTPWLAAQQSRDGAMDLDASTKSHPVITPVDDPARMDEFFDQITYDKGQGVVSMLQAWLGDDRFRRAVADYIHADANGSASSADLWLRLKAADPRAETVARAFTERAGAPLLSVSVEPCRDGVRRVRLSQSRFTDTGSTPADPWPIPLRLGVIGAPVEPYVLVDRAQQVVTVKGCGAVLANAGQAAYARVAYDDKAFAEVLDGLAAVGAPDALGLVEDNWALAKAGSVRVDRSLELIARLPLSLPTPVWEEELSVLRRLDKMYQPGPARDRLRGFARATLRRVAAGSADQDLRREAADRLASYDDPAALADARKALEGMLDGRDGGVQARRLALDIGVAHADAALYDRVLAWTRKAATSDDRTQALRALAGVLDPALAQRSLELTLSDEVPTGVAYEMLLELAANHGPMVKAFVDAHAAGYANRLRAIDQAELATAVKPPEDTLRQQTMRADADAWLAAHGPKA
jgi:aminopeptidase N